MWLVTTVLDNAGIVRLTPYRQHRRGVRKVGHVDGLCKELLRQCDMQVIRNSNRVERHVDVDVQQVQWRFRAFESFCRQFRFQNNLCQVWKCKKC